MQIDHDTLGIHIICFIQFLIFSSQTDYMTELLEEVLRLTEEVPSIKLAIQKAMTHLQLSVLATQITNRLTILRL